MFWRLLRAATPEAMLPGLLAVSEVRAAPQMGPASLVEIGAGVWARRAARACCRRRLEERGQRETWPGCGRRLVALVEV